MKSPTPTLLGLALLVVCQIPPFSGLFEHLWLESANPLWFFLLLLIPLAGAWMTIDGLRMPASAQASRPQS